MFDAQTSLNNNSKPQDGMGRKKKVVVVAPDVPTTHKKEKTIEELEAEVTAMKAEERTMVSALQMAVLHDDDDELGASKDDAMPQDGEMEHACAMGAYAAGPVQDSDADDAPTPSSEADSRFHEAVAMKAKTGPWWVPRSHRAIQGNAMREGLVSENATVTPCGQTQQKRSAMQGKPQGGSAPVIPAGHAIDHYKEIPKRKQADPIEVAIIQVMEQHSLKEIPKAGPYKSMFDELVAIKMKKLVQSRVNRMKRRANRKKQ